MNSSKVSKSFLVFILLSSWIVFFRGNNIVQNEISWDVFGYYLPLQATFIADDPLLSDRAWVEKLNAEHKVSGTLYQISSTHEGDPMYFFLFGMSYMYSLFFGIGHMLAGWLGYAQNGLSPPYQYALVYGCMLYTIIGLYYFRKILAHYFSDTVVAILLVICVLGTNYSHHMTLKNLETVNILFMFTAVIIWNTMQWYAHFKFKNLLAIGISITLMALCKPSEILIGILPVLWGVSSLGQLKERFLLFWNYRKHLLAVIAVCFLIGLPQMYYWYVKTGQIVFDTYKNPGVGLDLFSPHIFESLFSYRKGWLLYTPIMVFALIGFYFLYKQKKELFFVLLIQFLASFYIIASWTEYWYGAGFSNRPVISLYPILFIPLGYFIVWMVNQKWIIKGAFGVFVVFFIFLNQFQWWQLRNWILEPYRTTKEYYWSTFLATSVTDKQRELLLVNRDFSGIQKMERPHEYFAKNFSFQKDIDERDGQPKFIEYCFTNRIPYHRLTSKDHCWVNFSFDYKIPNPDSSKVTLSVMMDRSNGNYGNMYADLKPSDASWQHFDTLYLTPEIRSKNDKLMYFFWNQTKTNFEVENFKVTIYQKK